MLLGILSPTWNTIFFPLDETIKMFRTFLTTELTKTAIKYNTVAYEKKKMFERFIYPVG